MTMSEEVSDGDLAFRYHLFTDFEAYAEFSLKIRTKKGKIEPFVLNDAQLFAHKKIEEQLSLYGWVRAIILKGRQQGLSTYAEGRYYWKSTHNKGVLAYILTHEEKATQNIFAMAERYHQHCPVMLRPATGKANANELMFPAIDSGYKVGTAGNKATGRSGTIQLFHGSEVAYWPHAEDHAKGVLQTVPEEPDTEIILESTATGIGNYFHTQWQEAVAGHSDYIPIFIPWFWQKEYTRKAPDNFERTATESELIKVFSKKGLNSNDQLYWRRKKMAQLSGPDDDGSWAFKREYPNTPEEAFSSAETNGLISSNTAVTCREDESATQFGGLVLGVDPARFGDDRTSFIYRRGRVAFGLKSVTKKDTMQVAGLVVREIEKKKKTPQPIVRVFIDVGGLGAGVVDRLRELNYGHMLTAVNFGESAMADDRYVNKRAEIWGEMAAWMADSPCKIPDKDSLQADLCNPNYDRDSKGRLILESKKAMRKRGVKSPDEADALALTFSHPVSAELNGNNNFQSFGVADTNMGF